MLLARTGNTVCTAVGRLETSQKSSVAGVGKCRLLDTVRVCLISLNLIKYSNNNDFRLLTMPIGTGHAEYSSGHVWPYERL